MIRMLMHARNRLASPRSLHFGKASCYIFLQSTTAGFAKILAHMLTIPSPARLLGPISFILYYAKPLPVVILSCSHARSQTFLTLFTFLLFVSNLIISISAVPTVRWIIVTHDSSLFLLYRFSLLAKRDGRFHSKNKSNIE